MEKHQTEKIRKIKAIPDRRIDFYYRLLNGPEQLKRRKKQRITAALVIAAFLAAGHVLGVLKHSEKEYQKTIAKLEAFLEDETNQAADKSAQKLGDQVEKQDNMISDMENAKANIYSYPLVTSDVFKTLEDCCPDKVLITITGCWTPAQFSLTGPTSKPARTRKSSRRNRLRRQQRSTPGNCAERSTRKEKSWARSPLKMRMMKTIPRGVEAHRKPQKRLFPPQTRTAECS